jgi:tRNA(Ile)-lysidine synthase
LNLLQRYQTHIKAEKLFSNADHLLLAVSGGVDSVVLCELCFQSGFSFSIAHCNFQLRGEESERDETFVRALAEKYKVTVFVKKFDTEKYAADHKLSIQEAARKLRYEWFNQLVNSHESLVVSQASVSRLTSHVPILTAHHADDNIETLVMNFCRGTGLHGLTGIPAVNGSVRRPLLCFSKEELLQFARENKLAFVEDSSNQSVKYTRNLFRHEIIPAIEKVYPQVKVNLLDNLERFKSIEALYTIAVDKLLQKLVRQKGAEWHVPVKQLMGYNNKALVYELIARFGFSEKQVEEVTKLSWAGSGKYIESADHRHRIIRHRHWFVIGPVQAAKDSMLVVEKGTSEVETENGTLFIKETVQFKDFPANPYEALLDAKEIQFPLLLRKWKTGDYFYPLGMKKKKKLSRFFIDLKLSKTEKENVWVLEMNKKIIWVVGYRIDERFKINPQTGAALHLTFTENRLQNG